MRFNDIFLYEFRCISIAISHEKEMCTNVNYKKPWYRIKQILLRLVFRTFFNKTTKYVKTVFLRQRGLKCSASSMNYLSHA